MIITFIETLNVLVRDIRHFTLAKPISPSKTRITFVNGKAGSGKTMLGLLLKEVNKFLHGGDCQLQSMIADKRQKAKVSFAFEDPYEPTTYQLDIMFNQHALLEERLYAAPSYGQQNRMNDSSIIYEWRGTHRIFVSHTTILSSINRDFTNWHIAAGNMPVRGSIQDTEQLATLLKLVDPHVRSVKESDDSPRFIVIDHARRGPIVLVDGELREADRQIMSRSMTDMLDLARVIEQMSEPGLFYIDERLESLPREAAREVISICKSRLKPGSHLLITSRNVNDLPVNTLGYDNVCEL